MDLLDRLLKHDAWTTKQLLLLSWDLNDEQLDQEFDIGHRSLRRTFEHLIYNMEAWTDCMRGTAIRPRGGNSIPEFLKRLDLAANDLEATALPVAGRNGWDERWTDPSDGNERSFGGAIAHVVTHSMHHRAQLLYLLRRVGVKNLPEGDVLSWEKNVEDDS